jgi:succinate dehydrogenase/fumarate reductase flavoprotein subunit
VDFLNTGPALSATLRRQVASAPGITRLSNVAAVEVVTRGGRACGAVALDLEAGAPLTIDAKTTILAAGGLTKLFRRNSASTNMGGEAYALALRAPISRPDWSAWTPSCGTPSATSSVDGS